MDPNGCPAKLAQGVTLALVLGGVMGNIQVLPQISRFAHCTRFNGEHSFLYFVDSWHLLVAHTHIAHSYAVCSFLYRLAKLEFPNARMKRQILLGFYGRMIVRPVLSFSVFLVALSILRCIFF